MDRETASARPTLARDHVGLIHTIGARASVRRAIVERTKLLSAGEIVAIDDQSYRIDGQLGHGMIGVTYRARATGRNANGPVAIKRARAPFPLFASILRAEIASARLLATHTNMRVAPILAAGEHMLVKELIDGPTLQELMFEQRLEEEPRRALERLLVEVAKVRGNLDLHVDPSPKNLAWHEGRLWLLDPGQPMLRQPLDAMLSDGSFDAYASFYAPKLISSRSEPSAMAAPRSQTRSTTADAGSKRVVAARYALLRDWDLWIEVARIELPRDLLAHVDERARATEIVLFADRQQGSFVLTDGPGFTPGRDEDLRSWAASNPPPPSEDAHVEKSIRPKCL